MCLLMDLMDLLGPFASPKQAASLHSENRVLFDPGHPPQPPCSPDGRCPPSQAARGAGGRASSRAKALSTGNQKSIRKMPPALINSAISLRRGGDDVRRGGEGGRRQNMTLLAESTQPSIVFPPPPGDAGLDAARPLRPAGGWVLGAGGWGLPVLGWRWQGGLQTPARCWNGSWQGLGLRVQLSERGWCWWGTGGTGSAASSHRHKGVSLSGPSWGCREG